MASDTVALMRNLGHERFAVVGHGRGAYVASRLTLDRPEAVGHWVVVNAVPIAEALNRRDARLAASWWHWFFLEQTAKPAERVIGADPDAWYRIAREQMGEEVYADLRRALHDPATVRAMCGDCGAGLGIDRAHDDADRAAGRRIACPTLVIWVLGDDLPALYGDVLAIWRPWAANLRGATLDCGQHMAEEEPEGLAALLRAFLAG